MPQDERSVRLWLEAISEGDEAAADRLWEECFAGLARFATAQVRGVRDASGQDFALSALATFVKGLQDGKHRQITDRTEMWKLLQTITKRRVYKKLRALRAAKRADGRVCDESVFIQADGEVGLGLEGFARDAFDYGELPADLAVEAENTCNHLMELLNDETLRRIVELRLEGRTVAEIADELVCSKSSVETRIALIKKKWKKYQEDVEGACEPVR